MSIKRSNQHQHPSRWGATREHLVAVCSCNCIFKYICMRPTAEFRQETRNLYNLCMMLAFLVTCRLGRLYNQKHQRHGNGIRRLTWLYASRVPAPWRTSSSSASIRRQQPWREAGSVSLEMFTFGLSLESSGSVGLSGAAHVCNFSKNPGNRLKHAEALQHEVTA